MIRACLCVLAGALAPQLSSFPLSSDLFVGGLVALIVLLPKIRRRDLLWLLAGAAAFVGMSSVLIEGRLDHRYTGDSILSTVRVVGFPRYDGATSRFDVTALSDARLPGRVRLSWFEPPVRPRAGDTWQLEMRLKAPRANRNPGTADVEARLLTQRIAATGYVVTGRHTRLVDSGTATGLLRLRQRIAARVVRVVGDTDAAAVLAAVTVGARQRLSNAQWQRYAATGTSHLMAISGLHIGLAALSAYAVASLALGLTCRARCTRTLAALVALCAALVYTALSGFGLPARRAALMLSLVTVALLARREFAGTQALAAAALAVALLDPVATLSPGFRLSFAAVLALLWAARRRDSDAAHAALVPVVGARRLASVQLTLFFALLPVVALSFARVSLSAPVVNLVAVPVFSLITIPAGLLGLLLDGPFEAAGDPLLRLSAASIAGLETIIGYAAGLGPASAPVAAVEGLGWILLLLPLVWVLLPAHWPGRGIAFLATLGLLVWRPGAPPVGCVDLHVLDVGQGAAIVLQTRSHALVYDTGPRYRAGGDAARAIVLPFLQSRGIDTVDRLVVSHSDLDHAGGLPTLLAGTAVDRLVVGEALRGPGRSAEGCVAGQRWAYDAVAFEFLHPLPAAEPIGNDASCVLLISAGERRALLTGDIEAGVESRLVRDRVLPTVDVVTVPHHGSRTSSTAPFVRALRPVHAIVSAANGNRWGFPKADVVARWQSVGATVWNTAASGALSTRLCAGAGVRDPIGYRDSNRRNWHAD